MSTVPLREVALARSGDKGGHVHIGVIAKHPDIYPHLLEQLTSTLIQSHFSKLHPQSVERFLLPNIHCFNFLLRGVLDGGGSRCLRIDTQGKAMGQAILEIQVDIPTSLLKKVNQ